MPNGEMCRCGHPADDHHDETGACYNPDCDCDEFAAEDWL